ncbi:Alcohol dehydrogenase YqhD [Leclercia adecarboxylata]|uniref:Alcohol dehydrogenase YqhD n=1 Tax=Leclercia adecarboxylata TaxID=83655 RepID=A0A4U9IR21_9ENTR|nr:Alcohol dehydrogenase YqhD [Leclercia adecarboxylata]
MNNFNLHTPTRILFGKDAIADLRGQIPADARVLITYGGGSVKKNGVLDQVYSALQGLDVREFGGHRAEPILRNPDECRENRPRREDHLPAGSGWRLSARRHQIYRRSGALR